MTTSPGSDKTRPARWRTALYYARVILLVCLGSVVLSEISVPYLQGGRGSGHPRDMATLEVLLDGGDPAPPPGTSYQLVVERLDDKARVATRAEFRVAEEPPPPEGAVPGATPLLRCKATIQRDAVTWRRETANFTEGFCRAVGLKRVPPADSYTLRIVGDPPVETDPPSVRFPREGSATVQFTVRSASSASTGRKVPQ
jgi:hypothetical protein